MLKDVLLLFSLDGVNETDNTVALANAMEKPLSERLKRRTPMSSQWRPSRRATAIVRCHLEE
jgi:hypothetical protein